MKKYVEILEDIENAKAMMCDTAKTERDMERALFVDAWKHGTDAEIDAAHKKYKEAEARYNTQVEENTRLKVLIQVLTDNAAQAFFAENINTICDIWNKYAGKPHGEKTAKKIRDEIREAIGTYCTIGNKYDNTCISVMFGYGDLTFNASNGKKKIPALVENKIQTIAPENMRLWYTGEYVENPEEHVSAIYAAHAAALKAQAELSEAISKYNNLCRGKINHASIREGVNNWII